MIYSKSQERVSGGTMTRRGFVLALATCAATALTGLSACSEPQQESASAEPEAQDEPMEYYEDVVEEEVVEEIPETPAETDPLAVLEISESWVRDQYLVCLYRDGRLYGLGNHISEENSKAFDMGWRFYGGGIEGTPYPIFESQTEGYYTSMGDVPVPALNGSDEIRGYNVTSIFLHPAEKVGDTLRLIEGHNSFPSADFVLLFDSLDADFPIKVYVDEQQFEVRDSQGTLVDYHNLDYMGNYTVSWFEGTQYNEMQMVADSHCYYTDTPGFHYQYMYEVDGELTKDGYATFDLSGIPAGLYVISYPSGAGKFFIEIQ